MYGKEGIEVRFCSLQASAEGATARVGLLWVLKPR